MTSPDQHKSSELKRLLSRPPATNLLTAFAEGLMTPWRGLQYLRGHPDLWSFAALPILCNLLITAVTMGVAFGATAWLISRMHTGVVAEQQGVWWYLALAAEILAGIAMVLMAGLMAIITWRILTGILCGYFNSKLTAQVEHRLGNAPEKLREITFTYEMIDMAFDLGLLVLVNGALLLLNILPIVGTIVALILGTYFTLMVLGVEFLGMPLSFRGYRRLEKLRFGFRHQGHTLGVAAGVFFLQFIPIVGAVVLTTVIVGAVLLNRRLEHYQSQREASALAPASAQVDAEQPT